MLEEKFNTIIEQNTDITNQNKNIIDLQIQIAQHMGIDLNKIKTAGEMKPANNNEVR
jgi:predicted DsbA family dithiol-disulfide isomerase